MTVLRNFTPREVVSELDRYIVGQDEAKRAVAIALRNRWRRQQVPEDLRDEIAPKNIIMIGPTGVGKTEVARRLARLAQAPFIKVEASKFTEVGYVGRDVESIVRDLTEIGVALVLEEEKRSVARKADEFTEERLLDALLPSAEPPGFDALSDPAATASEDPAPGAETREKLRKLLRQGAFDDREIDIEVDESAGTPTMSIFTPQGVEEMGVQFKDLLGGLMPQKTRQRRMKLSAARSMIAAEEAARLVDMDRVREIAIERIERPVSCSSTRSTRWPWGSRGGPGRTCRARASSATCSRSSRGRRFRRSTARCRPTTCSSSRPAPFTSRSHRT